MAALAIMARGVQGRLDKVTMEGRHPNRAAGAVVQDRPVRRVRAQAVISRIVVPQAAAGQPLPSQVRQLPTLEEVVVLAGSAQALVVQVAVVQVELLLRMVGQAILGAMDRLSEVVAAVAAAVMIQVQMGVMAVLVSLLFATRMFFLMR